MTTIVYRDGILAADSMCDDGTVIKSMTSKKLYVSSSKSSMIACCGYSSFLSSFIGWWSELDSEYDVRPNCFCGPLTFKERKTVEGFRAIEVLHDGRVFMWDDDLSPYEENQDWYVVGSNYDLAWGALAMGATAYKAVEVCCSHGVHTGGPIQTAKLIDLVDITSRSAA